MVENLTTLVRERTHLAPDGQTTTIVLVPTDLRV